LTKRIVILPENITNKIAAGEVVERPASVIKELLENALDAGATDITIEISAGGRRLIRISDNGHGMSREDALLSLERHATSKIRTDSDLSGIMSLGFRGEALPSIASVSRFKLATREPETPEGTEIFVEGGKIRDVRACGMAPGTVISVEQIFFNTPARQKFMRSAETEAGYAGDTVTRMALSRPDVSFTFINDGREIIRVKRSDLLRRTAQILGKETAASLFPIKADISGLSLNGYVGGPAAARSNTASMFTYINGRFIRDKVVQHAIMQAYRSVIERGRYPVMALFITLPPGEVDVNVHPTKHEVRFRHHAVVHDAIQTAIESVLRGSPWIKGHHVRNDLNHTSASSQASKERIAAAAQTSLNMPVSTARFSCLPTQDTAVIQSLTDHDQAEAVHEPETDFRASFPDSKSQTAFFSSLSIIGQFHAEYILAQSGEELFIIDQHAASERVAYQRLQQQLNSGQVESQRLLLPETIELSFSEAAAARRFKDQLDSLGFEIEHFGGNTFIINAIPGIAECKAAPQLVRDVLSDLDQAGTSSTFLDILDALLSRIACHSVIRGMQRLETRQISVLLADMDKTDFAASCPHGRPVYHIVPLKELEKIFKRR